MPVFEIRYGDEGGSMVGSFDVVFADSLEEAAKKLGVELVPGTRRVIPNEFLRETVRAACGGIPFSEDVVNSLVLVLVEE